MRWLRLAAILLPGAALAGDVHLADITRAAGLSFQHANGAFGQKYLPETLGPGCAFLDYDRDGLPDILLVSGANWPGRKAVKAESALRLYRNTGDGRFTDVTAQSGLTTFAYGLGVAVGDYDNDGYSDVFLTAAGQSRLFRNKGNGTFTDQTRAAGLWGREALSTSAVWFDYDRDGDLDLFVANYVRWTPTTDVRCSIDGKRKSYCTPEAYRGDTVWLLKNRGDGAFEDVTAKAGLFDTSSKSLGVALLDYDMDGWPDLFVANDTQPNKLYRNDKGTRFEEVGVKAGVAFSDDGKARAGMGTDAGDYDNSGRFHIAVTNFNNEMLGLFRNDGSGMYTDVAPGSHLGKVTRGSLGFGCFFADFNLDGWLDLLVANGHIDDIAAALRSDVGFRQPPHLLLNRGGSSFTDIAGEAGGGFATPKLARGAAYADFDLDGDPDILLATNQGPAYLYRNDRKNANRSIRLELEGTRSNRDAVGAIVRIETPEMTQMRMVHGGSSYLSQPELPLTIGLGRNEKTGRVTVRWPSGTEEVIPALDSGYRYRLTEGRGLTDKSRLRPSTGD